MQTGGHTQSIVTSDGNQGIYAEFPDINQHLLDMFLIFKWICP